MLTPMLAQPRETQRVASSAVAHGRTRRRNPRADDLYRAIHEFRIAEFNKLRDEQFGRTVVQQALLTVNVTGGAAFLAFAATSFERDSVPLAYVLLGLPAISTALAFAYFELHYSIEKVGRYIEAVTEKQYELAKLRSGMASDGFGFWHSYLRVTDSKGHNTLTLLLRRVYMPACFFAPALVALYLAQVRFRQSIGDLEVWHLWMYWTIFGLLASLMVLTTVAWFVSVKPWGSSPARGFDP
jgi:hypothetical protein